MVSKLILVILSGLFGPTGANAASGPMEIPTYGTIFCTNETSGVELQVIRTHISENSLTVKGEPLADAELHIISSRLTSYSEETGDLGETITRSTFIMDTQLKGQLSSGPLKIRTQLTCSKTEFSELS